MPLKRNEYMRSLSSLWINWTFSIGAIAMSILLSLIIEPVYLPLCMFVLMFVLIALHKSNHMQSIPMCSHVVWVGTQVLLWSALIMLVINLLNTNWLFGKFFDAGNLNSDVPFIASLIIFPVTLIITIISIFRMGKSQACLECKERHGYTLEEGFVGNFVHNEVRYHSRLLIYISLFVTAIGWIYYFFFFINVNINTPDKFFFVILPIAVYTVSVVFLTIRYLGMSHMVSDPTKNTESHNVSILRFLVIKGDHLLINEQPVKGMKDITQWDTPAVERLSYRKHIDDETARRHFQHLTGYEGEFKLRALYTNNSFNDNTNIFHYTVFLPDDKIDDEITHLTDMKGDQIKLPGTWMTLYNINQLFRSNRLSSALSSEIHRIFTITMAWKTYDIEGRRLYPIKNYRPTFRLRDFKDWDVDYNDLRWLSVSSNNQDRRFYNLRRIWRRIFNGA